MWQDETFERIQAMLSDNAAVKEVVALGSLASHDTDEWSDLDVGIVVEEDGFDSFFPDYEWVKALGDIYAINQSSGSNKGTTRVVLEDGSRVDFSIATSTSLLSSEAPTFSAEAHAGSLRSITNDFKFDAFLATSKVARHDHLIGLHLILELERKCLVLGMMLRDREAGATHHRQGGPFNEVVKELKPFGTAKTELLGRLIHAADLFRELAIQLEPSIVLDLQPLKRSIDKARSAK
jgi:hypothetical protein